jgi:hypothetical protein
MTDFIERSIHDYITYAFNPDIGNVNERCDKIYTVFKRFTVYEASNLDAHVLSNHLSGVAGSMLTISLSSLPLSADGSFDFSALQPAKSDLRRRLDEDGGTGEALLRHFPFTVLDAKFNGVKIDGAGEDSQKLREAVAQLEDMLDSAIARAMSDFYSWKGFYGGTMTLSEYCSSSVKNWCLFGECVQKFKEDCVGVVEDPTVLSSLATNGDCLALSLKLSGEAWGAFREPIKL